MTKQMIYLIAKAALSGLIIAVVSEFAKRSPAFGALVVSLPLLSILAVIWLWRDTGDTERIAALMVLNILVCVAVSPDVPFDARVAAKWGRVCSELGCLLCADDPPLFTDCLGAVEIWNQSLTTSPPSHSAGVNARR